MRPSRVWRPMVCVLLAAVVASCSNGSGGSAAPDPGPATLPAPSGEPAGPAVPATTAPFAQLTPGVVSTADGMQQVLITGVDRFFQPGVFHMHPGTVRVILRNDDPVNVHNLIFPGHAGGRTKDTPPGQANSVTVVLTKPGLYDFICSYHELVGMRGQVKVE